jgi:hypothetical protein
LKKRTKKLLLNGPAHMKPALAWIKIKLGHRHGPLPAAPAQKFFASFF